MNKLKTAKESSLAATLRKAIGASNTEDVFAYTPTFDRPDGKVFPPPRNREEFDELKTLTPTELAARGLQLWDEKGLWLFPHNWYDAIPPGYPLIDLFYEPVVFRPGHSDKDRRFGYLAYGIVVSPNATSAKEDTRYD